MKLHRFIGDFDLSKKEVEITNLENIKQIKDVLRMKNGDILILSDGKGQNAEVMIELISKDKITCIVNTIHKENHIERKVNLYLAILKKENFELAVQKAVECGVSSITPIITERTIKTGLNMARLEKIIIEASEQSGRDILPELFEIFDFSEAINSQADEKIIFHTEEKTENYKSDSKALGHSLTGEAYSINIFVGPEGGFTEKEIKLAKESGFTTASLGSLTLRGETAAIIGTYRAVHNI